MACVRGQPFLLRYGEIAESAFEKIGRSVGRASGAKLFFDAFFFGCRFGFDASARGKRSFAPENETFFRFVFLVVDPGFDATRGLQYTVLEA